MIAKYLPLALSFLVTSLSAQNLVHNPGFKSDECVDSIANFTNIPFWQEANKGTGELFNNCHKKLTGIPQNFNGYQTAKLGNSYAGIYVYSMFDYREYITATLTQPLIKGQEYRVSFYISLAEKSPYAVQQFGVLLTDKAFKTNDAKNLSYLKLQQEGIPDFVFFNIKAPSFFNDTENWMLLEHTFTAKGNERYLTLGNFEDNLHTTKQVRIKDASYDAYYYIDDVSLKAVQPTDYTLQKTYTFQQLQFATNSAELNSDALYEITTLYQYLIQHPEIHIFIKGYTDNVGTPEDNQLLSTNRAKAVASKLINLGISKNRIRYQGFGQTQPLTNNTTEEGRAKNRRVTFTLTTTNTAN